METQTPTKTKTDAVTRRLRHPFEYLDFIRWIATPAPLRAPKTQRELAKNFGVGEDILSDWKKREGFWDAIKQEIKVWGKYRTPDVLRGLYKRAKEGTASEVKLYLQFFEDFSEKNREDIEQRHIVITRGDGICIHSVNKNGDEPDLKQSL